MSNDLHITPMEVNTGNLDRYKKAFEANDMPMPLDKLMWQHRNYLKPSFISWIIDQDERVAGLYSSFFVDFIVDGQRRIASQSIDTLTDVNYRGKGLFIKLASDVYKRLAADGTPFIYGFPNSSSAPGFFKKLKWEMIGDGSVPFLVRPLRISFALKKIFKIRSITAIDDSVKISHKNIRELADFSNAEVNRLSALFLAGKRYCINRNTDYLNWRFIQKPGEDYKVFGFFEQETLKGFVVFTVKQKHGGNVGYIMDLVYDPATPDTGNRLLQYAVKYMKRSKADLVLAWNLKRSPSHKVFKGNLFFNIPARFQSIKLFFGACLFDEHIDKKDVFNADNWYISYCDSDTV